ncbi:MAG: ATP synthase subunit I [Methylophilus sp.]|nr:ATP synthase subunit I [Methylophilus sp.]
MKNGMNNINDGLAANNIYSKMIRWQLSATVVVALLAFMLSGMHAFFSVLAGGLSVIAGAWIAAKIAARSDDQTEPSAILINLLKAEAIKIIVIALLLFVSFKLYHQLVPIALIAGLAAAAVFSGAALAKTDKTI